MQHNGKKYLIPSIAIEIRIDYNIVWVDILQSVLNRKLRFLQVITNGI